MFSSGLGLLLKQHLKKDIVLPSLIQIRQKNKGKPRVKERMETAKKSQVLKSKPKNVLLEEIGTQRNTTFLAESPVDNVWVHNHYPQQKVSIEKALNSHKEFAQIDMLNNMKGTLYLKMILDMTTKKKTKMMPNIRQTVILPNVFPFGRPPNVLVICKVEEQMSLAAKLGAHTYGTPTEIVKSITSGVVSPKEFDHVLATPDCQTEILSLRPHFRDKYPQRAKGNMSFDLEAMWDLFFNGYTYESQKITDSLGSLQVPLGLIEMEMEELVENFETYIENIAKLRSIALGPFIKSIKVVAPPSPEEFLLKVEDYVPGYKNEEVDSDEEDELFEEAA